MTQTPSSDTSLASQPRAARDWNGVAAIIAALVGLLALCVSGYTASLQRQQVRAQVWPYLQTGISLSQHAMSLQNKGVGPAIIEHVKVFVDGKPQRSWPQVFDALGLSELRDTRPSTINGVVLSPNDTIQQITLKEQDAFTRFYAKYPLIQMQICYCSALDECWVMDERQDDRSKRRQAVPACAAPDADEFVDNKLVASPNASDGEH